MVKVFVSHCESNRTHRSRVRLSSNASRTYISWMAKFSQLQLKMWLTNYTEMTPPPQPPPPPHTHPNSIKKSEPTVSILVWQTKIICQNLILKYHECHPALQLLIELQLAKRGNIWAHMDGVGRMFYGNGNRTCLTLTSSSLYTFLTSL